MIRGTTASYKFKLPYPKEELAWVKIKFWQPNNPSRLLPITKAMDHCDVTDDPQELVVSLTAEETARFSDKYKAKLQFRSQHAASGAIFGCKEKIITVYPMRDDMSGDPILPPTNNESIVILDGKTIIDR